MCDPLHFLYVVSAGQIRSEYKYHLVLQLGLRLYYAKSSTKVDFQVHVLGFQQNERSDHLNEIILSRSGGLSEEI